MILTKRRKPCRQISPLLRSFGAGAEQDMLFKERLFLF